MVTDGPLFPESPSISLSFLSIFSPDPVPELGLVSGPCGWDPVSPHFTLRGTERVVSGGQEALDWGRGDLNTTHLTKNVLFNFSWITSLLCTFVSCPRCGLGQTSDFREFFFFLFFFPFIYSNISSFT